MVMCRLFAPSMQCANIKRVNELAAELFMSSGKEYLQLGLRNADACLFYALEAGKKIIDVNKAFLVAQKLSLSAIPKGKLQD